MPQDPGGSGTAPSPSGEPSPGGHGEGTRSRNRNRNRRSQRSLGDASFTGPVDELKGHVYDIHAHNAGQVLFDNTTLEIA
eukprot:scaffold20328_cov132-Cylindrotheca_fusiformis.AAC.1